MHSDDDPFDNTEIEKRIFFQTLQENTDCSIDYAKLNRELDLESSDEDLRDFTEILPPQITDREQKSDAYSLSFESDIENQRLEEPSVLQHTFSHLASESTTNRMSENDYSVPFKTENMNDTNVFQLNSEADKEKIVKVEEYKTRKSRNSGRVSSKIRSPKNNNLMNHKLHLENEPVGNISPPRGPQDLSSKTKIKSKRFSPSNMFDKEMVVDRGSGSQTSMVPDSTIMNDFAETVSIQQSEIKSKNIHIEKLDSEVASAVQEVNDCKSQIAFFEAALQDEQTNNSKFIKEPSINLIEKNEEINKLRREIELLEIALRDEQENNKVISSKKNSSLSSDTERKLRKEIEEQEALISGVSKCSYLSLD